jgi:hypothetical protein
VIKDYKLVVQKYKPVNQIQNKYKNMKVGSPIKRVTDFENDEVEFFLHVEQSPVKDGIV